MALRQGIEWVLRCRDCEWVPEKDIPVGVAKAHFETEHPGVDLGFELEPRCPRDNATLPMLRTVHRTKDDLGIFVCPECHRTYRASFKQQEAL